MRALLVLAVIGFGAGAAAGIWVGLANVRETRDAFYRDHALADVEVILSTPVPEASIPAIPSADHLEGRLVVDGLIPDDRLPARLIGMPPDAMLDRLAVVSGTGLSANDPNGVLVDPEAAGVLGLRPGDPITVRVAERLLDLHVVGTGQTPDMLLANADPAYLLPQRGSLAVITMPREGLQARLGAGPVVDDVLIGGDVGIDEVARHLASLPVAQMLPAAEQYGRRFVDADVRSFAVMVPVLGAVFALVGAALILLELRRLVASQRPQLGALLALGYPARSVVGTVLRPALLLAVGGAVLAAGVAWGVGYLVAEEYAAAVGFPQVTATLSWVPLAGAAALALASTLLGATIPAVRVARLRPAEAMRGADAGDRPIPAWSIRIGRRLSPDRAYAIRGFVLRPGATTVTVLGLGGAVGLAIALAILVHSAATTIDDTFAAQTWTHQVTFVAPTDPARVAQLAGDAGAEAVEPFLAGSVRVDPGDEGARLIAAAPGADPLRPLRLDAGRAPVPGEVAVASQFARTANVHVGDRLRLTGPGGDETLVVSGILRTLAGRDLVAGWDDARALLGAGGATGALIRADATAADRLAADPAVSRITTKATLQEGVHEFIAELTGVLGILFTVSLGVGLVALATHLAVTALDRRGDFATLRALGERDRSVARIVVTEAVALTIPALLLAVPAAQLLARPLTDAFAGAAFTVVVTPTPADHLPLLLALPLAAAVGLLVARRIVADDLAAVFRARSIG